MQLGKHPLGAGNAKSARAGHQGQVGSTPGAGGKGQEAASLVVRWRSALVQGMQVVNEAKARRIHQHLMPKDL